MNAVSVSGVSLLLAIADGIFLEGNPYLLIGTAAIYIGCCITSNKTITIEEKE